MKDFIRRFFLKTISLAAGKELIVSCSIPKRLESYPACPTYDQQKLPKSEFINAWIKIAPETEKYPKGKVIFILDRVEMGQGTMTSHATMIAEEMGIPPEEIDIAFAPLGYMYAHPKFRIQTTGGSESTATSWKPLRMAAAEAREKLKMAEESLISVTASKFNVSETECEIINKKIIHKPTQKVLAYGSIVERAVKLSSTKTPELKSSSFMLTEQSYEKLKAENLPVDTINRLKNLHNQKFTDEKEFLSAIEKEIGYEQFIKYRSSILKSVFKYFCTSVPRLDSKMKIDGSGCFGIDVQVPGMLNAVVIRCPELTGGTVESYPGPEVWEKMKGVSNVFIISSGLAVVADTFWHAHKAAEELREKVSWKMNDNPQRQELLKSNSKLMDHYANLLNKPGNKILSKGAFQKKGSYTGIKNIESIFKLPYLPHSTLEPINCTAYVTDDSCEIWVPTQSPGFAHLAAKKVTGLPMANIQVHTTLIGGGFGRRLVQEFVYDAAEISKKIKKPVKVIWTREDDFKYDFYRPATLHLLKGGINADGTLNWFHHIIGQSIYNYFASCFNKIYIPNFNIAGVNFDMIDCLPAVNRTKMLVKNLLSKKLPKYDPTAVEGAKEIPYAIDNIRLQYTMPEPDPYITIGYWRSVGHSYNAFVVESFIDELAHLSEEDPYEFRCRLLKPDLLDQKKRIERTLAVLQLVHDKSGYEPYHISSLSNTYYGIAQHNSFGTYCAIVVVLKKTDKIRLHRVVCAVDCGFVINPDIVKSQAEGAIIFGLTAALKQKITFKNGRVEQTNFLPDGGELLRMNEAPDIEVYINDNLSYFELTEQSFNNLKEDGLPENTISRLRKMANHKFSSDEKFLESVEKEIGHEETQKYKLAVLKSSDNFISFPPTGIGEPVVPPTAPALCNALYQATRNGKEQGLRMRKLPVLQDINFDSKRV